MSTNNNKGVPGVPLQALNSIKDENTRLVLQSIVDGWHVRNGATGQGDSRFITAGELDTTKNNISTIIGQLSQDVNNATTGTLSQSQIDNIINRVQSEVIASQLWQDLGETINYTNLPTELIEQLDADRLALEQEIADRVAAIEQETTDRIQALTDQAELFAEGLQAEADARAAAILAEAEARGTAITDESTIRQEADDQLASLVSTLTATITNNQTTALSAIQNEASTRADADAAEALERNTLAVQMRGNYTGSDLDLITSGLLYSERQARATADTANATAVSALSASVENSVNKLTAQIAQEQSARVAADAAEANDRQAIRAQLLGDYTGNDLSQLTSGLLYQERNARVTQTSALAQQISLLTAEVGGGFDPVMTWYFDGSDDGWSNGTYAAGWITVSTTTERDMPTGGIDGTKYSSVKMRIKRVSGSSWTGRMYYTANGTVYTQDIINPVLAVGADTVIEWEMSTVTNWTTKTITHIKFELGGVFDIDWIAVGRNGPAASTASIAEEALARSEADSSEASKRETLSTKLVGVADPTDVTLSTLSTGLLADERNLRTTADANEATKRETLSIKILGGPDPNNIGSLATLSSGLLFDESRARITANTAMVERVTSLTATVNNNYASLNTRVTALTDADTAQLNTLNTLTARMNTAESAITSEVNARTTADLATLTQLNSAVTRIGKTETGLSSEITNRVNAVSALSTSTTSQFSTVNGNIANLQTTTTTLSNNVSSLTSTVNTLQATVGSNTSAIQNEATIRANADGTINSKYTIKIDTNGYVAGYGLISTANNGTLLSDFTVRADKFAIGSPSGPGITPRVPFVVRTTSETMLDGTVIAPGVYMDYAMVKRLEGAYINAGRLRAGKIYTGSQYVDSDSKQNIPAVGVTSWSTTITQSQVMDNRYLGPITSLSLRFYGPNYHSDSNYYQRVRSYGVNAISVAFVVTVMCVADHHLSLWFRVNSGNWELLTKTVTPGTSYDFSGLAFNFSTFIFNDTYVDFGIFPTDGVNTAGSWSQWGSPLDTGKLAIKDMTFNVMVINL